MKKTYLIIGGLVFVILILAGIFLFIPSSTNNTNNQNTNMENTKSYTNNIYKFSFNYNNDWTIMRDSNSTGQTSTGADEVVIQIGAPTVNDFSDNFNMIVADSSLTSDQLVNYMLQYTDNLSKMNGVTNFALLSNEQFDTNGTKGTRITYTASLNNFAVKQTQYFVVHNGKLYSMTYTAVPETFDSHKAGMDTIINSLKLN